MVSCDRPVTVRSLVVAPWQWCLLIGSSVYLPKWIASHVRPGDRAWHKTAIYRVAPRSCPKGTLESESPGDSCVRASPSRRGRRALILLLPQTALYLTWELELVLSARSSEAQGSLSAGASPGEAGTLELGGCRSGHRRQGHRSWCLE